MKVKDNVLNNESRNVKSTEIGIDTVFRGRLGVPGSESVCLRFRFGILDLVNPSRVWLDGNGTVEVHGYKPVNAELVIHSNKD